MLGYGVQEIMNKSFYSLQDGKTPMRVAFFGIAVNIALSLLFVLGFKKGLGSLALAASLSANVTGFTLLYKLSKKHKGLLNKTFLKNVLKILLSVAIMSLVVMAIYIPLKSAGFSKFILALVPSVVGAIVYLICCIVLKVEELYSFLNVIKMKFISKDRG